MSSQRNETDIARRAIARLKAFFREHPGLQRSVLDEAFGGCAKDPRGLIRADVEPDAFAVDCVTKLLAFECTDGHRHSLGWLLAVIRDGYLGAKPHPDYVELPRLLDQDCAVPTREEELRYLQDLITREEAIARLYSPLHAIAQSLPAQRVAPLFAPWRDHKDITLLLHRPRDAHEESGREGATRHYDDILAAFAEVKQAALLGAPGAGKSTTLRKLAVDIARRAMEDPKAPLPLFLSLGSWVGNDDLAAFLASQVPEIGRASMATAQRGHLVFLLDGLNEVPTAQRKVKAEQIRVFRENLPEGTPLIVSCRKDDFVGDLKLDLDSLSLEPMTPPRVRAVLQHWLSQDTEHLAPGTADQLFWQLAGDEEQRLLPVLETWLGGGREEEDFWAVSTWPGRPILDGIDWDEWEIWTRCAQDPSSLLRLAANPFMLTMLYVTWIQNAGALPRNRGELFAAFTDALLSREGLIRKDPHTGELRRDARADPLLGKLANVAMSMQLTRRVMEVADSGGPVDYGVLTVIPRRDAARLLGDESLLKLAVDATLLEAVDRAQIRFRHQLLQEYFTAIALKQDLVSGGLDANRLWPRDRWWERSSWEEAAVLLTGFYSDDCTPVIRWLKDVQPEVAAQCILESGAALADRDALLPELHDAWLPRLTDIELEPAPEARAAVGRALGRLGLDDRKGVGLRPDGLPDIDWVEISGSEFIYQDGERRTCETFQIARYPITHAQFQAFLEAEGGYASHGWWAGLDNPDRQPHSARSLISNHPRERVSWFEAMAFCAWLGYRLDLEIRLPTEWEWERAARGTTGRVYPWGGEYQTGYANIDETLDDVGPHSLARTCTVGIYPQGASPEGVLDLSGNVWEWCLNEYDNPERVGPEGSVPRVLRGGSWGLTHGNVRAVSRYSWHPGYRNPTFAFRVLCVSTIR